MSAVAGEEVEVALGVTERDERRLGALEERATTVAFGLGWRRAAEGTDDPLRFRPNRP